MADVVIRAARAADAPAVTRLYVSAGDAGYGRLVGRRPLDDALVARRRDDLASGPARWWVAEDAAGTVVGVAGPDRAGTRSSPGSASSTRSPSTRPDGAPGSAGR